MAQGISTIWFFSGFPILFFKVIGLLKNKDEVFTQEEWEVWISNKSDFFGELLTCPVCLSVWISTIVSLSMCFICEYNFLFVAASVLSWPFIMFAGFKFLER